MKNVPGMKPWFHGELPTTAVTMGGNEVETRLRGPKGKNLLQNVMTVDRPI
jgi:hypothetical protein